ncbi:unnamed protein product [Brassica napus]|uniref:(rape) hypothetical protein n=1 Tax=Brassica napus TaxID=3708 RepID=A0A816II82_BRANA|nr:unnamed protein product [Brassica napus]
MTEKGNHRDQSLAQQSGSVGCFNVFQCVSGCRGGEKTQTKPIQTKLCSLHNPIVSCFTQPE